MKRSTRAFALLTLLCQACASTTVIKTTPPGAKVIADGDVLGESPVFYGDEKISWSTTQVLITKPGCEPLQVKLKRDEEAQIGPIVAGVFLLVPLFWMMGYRPSHHYELKCADSPNS